MCILLVLGTAAVCAFSGVIICGTDSVMATVFLAYLLENALAISSGMTADTEKVRKVFFCCFLCCLLALTASLLVTGVKNGLGSAPENKVIVIILLFAFTLLFSYMVITVHYIRKKVYNDMLKGTSADADDDD